MPRNFGLVSELLIGTILLLESLPAMAVPGQANTPEGRRLAEAVGVDRAPKLDGTLDDPIWQSAKAITDFRQREPRRVNQPQRKLKYVFCIPGTRCISAFIALIPHPRELLRRSCAVM